jgi:hypothetical protein
MSQEESSFILWRNDQVSLKFSGKRIASVTRAVSEWDEDDPGSITVELYQTRGNNCVINIFTNQGEEAAYASSITANEIRFAVAAASIEELAQKASEECPIDKDCLSRLFQGTEVEDMFVEKID